MSRRRHREELRNISQLDVTPLVDLTFLLLIVFMITAPALEYAVDVSPPELNAERIETETQRTITLTHGGGYVLDGRNLSLAELQRELAAIVRGDAGVDLYIRADSNRRYGEVMEVMRLARRLGFEHVNLVTQEEG